MCKTYRLRMGRSLLIAVVTSLLCGIPLIANAVPVTYSLDYVGTGSGVFTLDIGSAPGIYMATGVSGGPSSLWNPTDPAANHGYALPAWTDVWLDGGPGLVGTLWIKGTGNSGQAVTAGYSLDSLPAGFDIHSVRSIPDSTSSVVLLMSALACLGMKGAWTSRQLECARRVCS